MRRMRPELCARAANGQAIVAPPNSRMNFRRCMKATRSKSAFYHIIAERLGCASQQIDPAHVAEWDGPAVLPPRTAQRMTGGLEARGAHRYVP